MPHSVRATNLNAAVTITTTTTTNTALATTTTTLRIRTPVPPSPMLADWSRAQDRSSITFAEILLAGATAAKWATPLHPPLTHAHTVTRHFCFRGPHLRVLLSAATLPPRLC